VSLVFNRIEDISNSEEENQMTKQDILVLDSYCMILLNLVHDSVEFGA